MAAADPLPRPATHGSILGVAGRGSGSVVQIYQSPMGMAGGAISIALPPLQWRSLMPASLRT